MSIRIPLAVPYARAKQATQRLSALLLLLLAVIFGVHHSLTRRLVTLPVVALRDGLRTITGNPVRLGTEIALFSTGKLKDLAVAFNGMSRALRANVDEMEERVRERTRELIEVLANVKTLAGLIPICAHCKSVRDDDGYWQQVDSYVAQHSYAEFTHGIRPACAQKYYPGLLDDKPEIG